MEQSQRSGSPNNQEWRHEPIQSPRETTSTLPSYGSFDPPPPPSPTRVYVSPAYLRRNRSDQQDSFLSCKNYSTASFCATMSLNSLAIPSLDFSTVASTRPQEVVSLRPRFSYFTPGEPDHHQLHVSARERRANVARILGEALHIMEDYSEENGDDAGPVNNF
jgi:hypothetical protein